MLVKYQLTMKINFDQPTIDNRDDFKILFMTELGKVKFCFPKCNSMKLRSNVFTNFYFLFLLSESKTFTGLPVTLCSSVTQSSVSLFHGCTKKEQ
jgi:hypothetical protein